MAAKRASDDIFIQSTIRSVAQGGIENLHTKEVADCAGFSEATLFRHFATKEDLLEKAFLYVDKSVSTLLTRNLAAHRPDGQPFEKTLYAVWHQVYRYLLENSDETIFLIRYRYSSLYTDQVRNKRVAYNGGFDKAYDIFETNFGKAIQEGRGFLINYLFEMTLCFAERIISKRAEDTPKNERRIWLAVTSAMKQFMIDTDEEENDR